MSRSTTHPERVPAARRRRQLVVFGLLLIAGTTFAQQKALPIKIESNNADLSQQSGESTYTGDVVLKRGGLTLTGDRLKISRINDRGNVSAVLTGAPARLDKQPDREGNDVVTGHAKQIEYANNTSTVVLRGNAVVERGGDQVRGQVIRHNIDTDRTQAERGDNGGSRVQITIQPQSDSKTP